MSYLPLTDGERQEMLDAMLALANRVGRPLPAHVKVDTGMHRVGAPLGTAIELAALATEPRAVKRITGTSEQERTRLRRSRPSLRGITMSVITTSGARRRNCSQASLPSEAWTTANPASSSSVASARRGRARSSTTSTVPRTLRSPDLGWYHESSSYLFRIKANFLYDCPKLPETVHR